MSTLLKTTTLTIDRTDPGYYDTSGRWVEGSTSSFTADGNLQPYQEDGRVQSKLPEGFTSENAVIFYTKTEIRTVSQFTKTKADTTTIDGLEYEAVKVENWSRYGLQSDHYKVTFAMKDQDTGGTL